MQHNSQSSENMSKIAIGVEPSIAQARIDHKPNGHARVTLTRNGLNAVMQRARFKLGLPLAEHKFEPHK